MADSNRIEIMNFFMFPSGLDMSSFLDATIIPQKCPRDEGSGPTGRVNGELWIVDGVRKERGRTAEPQNRD
jgi:hypothetical protein